MTEHVEYYRGCRLLAGEIADRWDVVAFRNGRPYESGQGDTLEDAIEATKRRIDAALGHEPQPELSEEW